MSIVDLFRSKAQQLFWEPLPADHVYQGVSGALIDKEQAYFVVRLTEMYVREARVLWRKLYPMLHGYVQHAGTEEYAVAGPGHLKELGERNLERIVNLNFRLTGPTVFHGGDVSLLVGLYSVPAQDTMKVLIDTIGTIASLGGVGLGQAVPIANAVKNGVEAILGLDGATLQLGVRDEFFQNNPLRAGYHIGIAAPRQEIEVERLWLKNGRLVTGTDPLQAVPYQDHDYMVVEIERRDTRDDWASLPAVVPHNDAFAVIMRDTGTSVEEKKAKIKAQWPAFLHDVHASRLLTQPDKEAIPANVLATLKKQLDVIGKGDIFETRSAITGRLEKRDPHRFDFVDVENFTAQLDGAARASAVAAGSAGTL